MSERVEILLAEDDEADVILLRRAFRDAGVTRTLQVARDGQEAIDMLTARSNDEQDCMPSLVILDLKMPRKNGMEVLQWIRAQPAMRCIPAFIFSSSAHREDIERAYVLGANGFMVKPPSTAERAVVARFFSDWLKMNQAPLASTEGFRTAQALHAIRGYDAAIARAL
jgi:CheY-like chemotaxis protein